MTGPLPPGQEPPRPVHADMMSGRHLTQGFDAVARMLSAMLVFGLPSWWLSEALDQRWIIPVGLVLGMAAAIALIWVRYGVHGP